MNTETVLRQTGNGTFPWCVKKDTSLADGFVEVKFKAVRGNEDQAGGVMRRGRRRRVDQGRSRAWFDDFSFGASK